MQKLSVKKELQMVRYYLRGMPYDEIVAKVGVGKGTVANIVSKLKAGQLPETGDLAGDVEALRELAVDLKQSKLSPSKAVVGIAVLSRLNEVGIESGDIESCVAASHILAEEGMDLPSFAGAAVALEEARQRTGLGIEELAKPKSTACLMASQVG
jgi:hypothetical protein